MGFFKTFFATLLALFSLFFFFFIIILALVISSQRETEPFIRDGSVLEITLGNTLSERAPSDPLSMLFTDPSRQPVTLDGLISNFEKAASDDRIAGVWIKANNIAAPWPHLVAFRDKMQDFRNNSGKFIYFSTDDIGFNEQSYFLATAADSIFSPPETFFEFDGFFIQAVFFSNLLEKLGVEAEIFRAGTYKSAVEPFEMTSFSEENREQLQSIVDHVADTFLNAVSERTGYSRSRLNAMLNDRPMLSARQAYQAGFIDELLYPDEIRTRVESRILELDYSELRTVTYQRYNRVSRKTAGIQSPPKNQKIAVIYASGNIVPQIEPTSPFTDRDDRITVPNMTENLEQAMEDDDVKAIVLRINSPGGAATTSDVLWHKIREAALEKPVIASFGPIAASGAYYIGMAADTIVASSQTITGSIGVFSVFLNAQELLNEKIGLTFDVVTSHDHSLWLSPDKPLSETSRNVLQAFVDDFYDVFLDRVSESRNMSRDEVDRVAQGRIWTGSQALEAGLVDVIGELDRALAIAAEKADIEDYVIEVFPKPKSLFEMFSGSAQSYVHSFFRPQIPELEYFQPVMDLLGTDRHSILARMPFDFEIN